VEKQGDKIRKILWKNKRTKTRKNITNLKQKNRAKKSHLRSYKNEHNKIVQKATGY
jgi:hypothetical protein